MNCDPCSASGRDNGPAEFLWHDPRGYKWPLCASCCSLWLAYACEDDTPSPFKVSPLEHAAP